MKAAVLFSPGDLRVVDVPVPEVNDREVLVKVGSVGVCGSDIPRVMTKGAHHMPITIGHEFSGEIAKVGKGVNGWKEGDRVTVAPLMPCFKCYWCQHGKFGLCEDYDYFGSRTNGALAEYVKVPATNLVRVPSNLSFEEAAMSDPAATALHTLERGKLGLQDTVAVYGVGPIGFFIIEWARILGLKQVIAVDVFEEKLELAKKIGATVLINAKKVDPVEAIMDVTDGFGAQMVIEAAGLETTQLQSILSTRKHGYAVFLGISYEKLDLPPKAVDQIMRKELYVTGSWNSNSLPFPGHEWQLAVDYMANKYLDAKTLISHRYRLEDAPQVFQKLIQRDFAFNKVVFNLQ
ncbi:MAG: galactitol-1-phosphate 5-dehydrogenase [Anaerolineales bacterium]